MSNILRIDLSNESVNYEDLDRNIAKNFIGGSGLCAKILYDELEKGVDPLSPDNKLIFAVGPVTGSKALFSGRHVVSAKSPLTRIYGQATSGGYFGAELKCSGIDAIILEGRADHPVYISIRDDNVEIKDAKALWGLDCLETEIRIKKDSEDKKTRVSCIGPAGENLVKFACIMNDDGSSAGRTGMGCVMGSKNLKAVAVRGTGEVPVADQGAIDVISKELRKTLRNDPVNGDLAKNGTLGVAIAMQFIGGFPTKYYQKGTFSKINNVSGHTMAKTILKKRATCYNCPIACKRVIEIKSGPYAGLSGRGAEYETCCAFGPLCLNDDLSLISKANDMCNRLGIDTISAGNVIAFSMECYERGLITKDKLDGIELDWGSPNMLLLISNISSREGFGDILAEGVRTAAGKIGAEEIAMHCKGLETAMFDPRALKGMGVVYSTSTRGACHLMGNTQVLEMGATYPSLNLPKRIDRKKEEHKGFVVKVLQDWKIFVDSMVACYHPLVRLLKGPEYTASIYSAVTGIETSVEDMLLTGERIYNIQRLFNLREGVPKDTLPKRFTQESLSEGASKGETVNLSPMLQEYYETRGWKDGVPTEEKLRALEL